MRQCVPSQKVAPPYLSSTAGAPCGYITVFSVLVQWNGLNVDADKNIRLAIAQFSL
jgi:hypothetical protein